MTRAHEKENVLLLKGSAPEATGSLFLSLEACRGIVIHGRSISDVQLVGAPGPFVGLSSSLLR